jgi:hypothetical protein
MMTAEEMLCLTHVTMFTTIHEHVQDSILASKPQLQELLE